uniref:Uncharacterized protein n=1 Tax=Anguilla anguilla TaxID=7936 RepID=A0A0E9S992_ANGAN
MENRVKSLVLKEMPTSALPIMNVRIGYTCHKSARSKW